MRKLQVRFVVMTMSCLLVILAVLVTVLNVLAYDAMVDNADRVLGILAKNDGTFPTEPVMAFPVTTASEPSDEPPSKHPEAPLAQESHTLRLFFSPELPHESRFFSVVLDVQGNMTEVDIDHIAAIDADEAVSRAVAVAEHGQERGFYGIYRYIKVRTEDHQRIIFLDTSNTMRSFFGTLANSIVVAFGLFAVVFLVIGFFSNRILRPIVESYEMQKRFIADAGHELKTPLTIIRADADVLEMELGGNEWLEDIQRQTQRLSELTQNLLLLSRMEEPKSTLTMIDFPLSDIASETVASFAALAKVHGREFTHHIEPMISMRGDEKSISHLISILLDNAIKYSPEGGTIRLCLERSTRSAVLTVFNTTRCPIPKDALPRLFDRFYRVDAARNSDVGGHGIGLSLAKAIVNAHGGRIQASIPEADTILFTVTLPV